MSAVMLPVVTSFTDERDADETTMPHPTPDHTLSPGPHAPNVSGDPRSKLIDEWVRIAISHARVRLIDGRPFADVAGINGPWGEGATAEEACEDLREVLADWLRLKMSDGDDDIPAMEGVRLTVE